MPASLEPFLRFCPIVLTLAPVRPLVIIERLAPGVSSKIAFVLAEASGSRTHLRTSRPHAGFEDQAQHRPRIASRPILPLALFPGLGRPVAFTGRSGTRCYDGNGRRPQRLSTASELVPAGLNPRREVIGEIPDCTCGSRTGRGGQVCAGLVDHDTVRGAVPAGYVRH